MKREVIRGWTVAGPLPGPGERYVVWRECSDGFCEEGIFVYSDERPKLISMRVYSLNDVERVNSERVRNVQMPPVPRSQKSYEAYET